MPKKARPAGGQSVNILLEYPEVGPNLLNLVGDVRKIVQGATQAVKTRDDQGIAGAEHREHLLQLHATVALRPASLLFKDDTDAGAFQRLPCSLVVGAGQR